MKRPIYKLKVTLQGSLPPIWRQVEVPADVRLLDLHMVLQGAMGWTNSHLHQFIHRGTYYGEPDDEFDMPIVSERRTRLGELLERCGDRLVYEYDFGDSWEHDVRLASIGEAEPDARYPRVVAGERACPPEDVGGYSGYMEFLEIIRDPEHEEHESTLRWAGGGFDPECFDVAAADRRVSKKCG